MAVVHYINYSGHRKRMGYTHYKHTWKYYDHGLHLDADLGDPGRPQGRGRGLPHEAGFGD